MKTALLICAGWLLLLGGFVLWGPQPLQPRFQSQDQLNQYIIERYADDPGRFPVVYVGSSMTARLAEEARTPDCAYNLGLHGESSLTGLAAIDRLGARPRVVFVESNVLERALNNALLATGMNPWARRLPIFRVEYRPVNMLLGWLYTWRSTHPAADIDEARLAAGLAVQKATYAQPLDAESLLIQVQQLKQLVARLQARGTRVVLFELPVNPALEPLPRAQQARMALMQAFPHLPRLESHDLSAGTAVRTIDGVHLSAHEAEVVAEHLRIRHAQVCGSEPAPAVTPEPKGSRP